jgi:hypothetical protein
MSARPSKPLPEKFMKIGDIEPATLLAAWRISLVVIALIIIVIAKTPGT